MSLDAAIPSFTDLAAGDQAKFHTVSWEMCILTFSQQSESMDSGQDFVLLPQRPHELTVTTRWPVALLDLSIQPYPRSVLPTKLFQESVSIKKLNLSTAPPEAVLSGVKRS